MKHLIFMSLAFLLFSCKSQMAFKEHTHIPEGSGRAVPYELGLATKESKRMVVFLRDNPDTVKIKDTKLLQYFVEKDYNIMIPGKPGEGAARQRSLDKKDARVRDVSSIITELDSLREDDLILVGFGEGGYLLPAIASNTEALASVAINAGPSSMLSELELIAQNDTINEETLKILEEKNIKDQSDLYTRVQSIKNKPNGAEQIAPNSNFYWLSYYESPTLDDLNNFRLPIVWIISEDYPLISVDSKNMLNAMTASYTNMEKSHIEGRGYFGDEEEMKQLIDVMDLFLMKRLSF